MTNQKIRNALDDLETAAERIEREGLDFDGTVIRECTGAIRSELDE